MTQRPSPEDPLASRVRRAVALVHDLRREVTGLKADLAEAKEAIRRLEGDRVTVRSRVQRMLEMIGS
jgi:hypothetical protein